MELEEFKPEKDFVISNSQSLVDFDVTDSTELWLIQCPKDPRDQYPDFNGKELTIKLDEDGNLGRFEDSSGKEFDLVSYAAQDADATVFIQSGEESKLVGKISRRVSLVRFQEPEELTEGMKMKSRQKLVGSVTNSSVKYSGLTKSSRQKTGQSGFTHSSRQKSTVSGYTVAPMSSKRKHSGSSDRSGKSMLTVSGSSDQSGKSKKKMKLEK